MDRTYILGKYIEEYGNVIQEISNRARYILNRSDGRLSSGYNEILEFMIGMNEDIQEGQLLNFPEGLNGNGEFLEYLSNVKYNLILTILRQIIDNYWAIENVLYLRDNSLNSMRSAIHDAHRISARIAVFNRLLRMAFRSDDTEELLDIRDSLYNILDRENDQ